MPRFSTKARQIYYNIYFGKGIVYAENQVAQLENPLDIAFVKSMMTYYYIFSVRMEPVEELLNEVQEINKELQDPLIDYILSMNMSRYYSGLNLPAIDDQLGTNYETKGLQSYADLEFIDDWERNLISGGYHQDLGGIERIKRNYKKANEHFLKSSEYLARLEDDGKLLASANLLVIGLCNMYLGKFEQARKSYTQGIKDLGDCPVTIWFLGNLAGLEYNLGEVNKALEINQQGLQLARTINEQAGIIMIANQRSFLLIAKGQFEEAIDLLRGIRHNIEDIRDSVQLFFNYYYIFFAYYNWYKTTKDGKEFSQVRTSLRELIDFAAQYPDNPVITNYSRFTRALIERHGNFTKKARALQDLKDLTRIYPDDIGIKLYLLELLFEDAASSDDPDTLENVENLIGQIEGIELRENPSAIFAYFSQQLLVARYTYYIKGNAQKALKTLEELRQTVDRYSLTTLEMELEQELKTFQQDQARWNELDIDIKQRIEQSQFADYVKHALKLLGKQHNT